MSKDFDAASHQWDAIADQWDENRTAPSATLALFRPFAHGTVLDVGCGNGRNSKELAKTSKRVIALDASAAMLEKAEKNLHGLNNVQTLHAGMQAIPLPDRFVDAVFCLAALHHLKPSEQSQALAEFFRVLKTGGTLCLTVWNRQQARFKHKPKEQDVPWHGKSRYYYFFDEDELHALLKAAGFAVEKTVYEKSGDPVAASDAQNLCMVAKKP